MSRTDNDRPYAVRCNDPYELRRYRTFYNGNKVSVWRLILFDFGHRPSQDDYRAFWSGPQRAAERAWSRRVIKGDYEALPPEGRHRHGLLWHWW